ncbi:MAG: hypothetical protein WAW03_14560, partial [Anaerolineae bacterium]
LRTVVVLAALTILVLASGQWQPLGQLPGKGLWLIVLSGLATGAFWLCCFRALKLGDASRVAPPSSSVNRVSDCYCYGWMAKNMTTTVVRGQVWAGSWRQRDRVDPEWFC